MRKEEVKELKAEFNKLMVLTAGITRTKMREVIHLCRDVKPVAELLKNKGLEGIRIWKRGNKYTYFEVKFKDKLLYFRLKELKWEELEAIMCAWSVLKVYNFCKRNNIE